MRGQRKQSYSSEHLCRDCGLPMDVIRQQNACGGYIKLLTCWNADCLLNTVTLSVDQYNSLTEFQLEAYREMNRRSRPNFLTV